MRDICAQYLVDNPVVMGGQGIEVESDESKFDVADGWKGTRFLVVWRGLQESFCLNPLQELRRPYSTFLAPYGQCM